MPLTSQARAVAVGAAAILVTTVWVYAPTRAHQFINLDDPGYVYENPRVLEGLTTSSVLWAFTSFDKANWHPLTWLSHQIDVELWGPHPGGHHLTAVALHCASALLLLLALWLATKQPVVAVAVAALFALHPTHVESVAWVSERKDVLSGLFWHLTLLLYVLHSRRPRATTLAAVAAAFALGLLAKPMLVTLPAVLVLLDVWPLRRAEATWKDGRWRTLLLEKVPLLALSIVSALMTVLAQSRGGAVSSLTSLTLSERFGNAAIAYVAYMSKLAWPADLAVFYPHPVFDGPGLATAKVLLSAAALGAISAVTVWQFRPRPYLFVGWAWFLGTLVPVIGLVQVGVQAMADRYLYLPATGLFLAVTWGAWEWARTSQVRATAFAVSMLAASVIAAFVAHGQVLLWKDSITLYEHTLTVTGPNPMTWQNLGTARLAQGDRSGAAEAFHRAAQLAPTEFVHWMNLGTVLLELGDAGSAARAFTNARSLEPQDLTALFSQARAFIELKDYRRAAATFELLVERNPGNSQALLSLGLAYAYAGEGDRASAVTRRLARVDPAAASLLTRRIGELKSVR